MKTIQHSIHGSTTGNIKNCPSFPDYFAQGYILPMWVDTILYFDDDTKNWQWKTANDKFQWASHPSGQLLDDVDFTHNGKKVYHIFKAICPWKIIAPKGWSVMQLPLFYHYENEFTVMPGIWEPGVFGDLNQQVMITANKKEILIKRGTPFAQYVFYKQTKTGLKIRNASAKDKKKFTAQNLLITGEFDGSRTYNRHKTK